MTTADATALVWSWVVPMIRFLGLGAAILLGFALMREITR